MQTSTGAAEDSLGNCMICDLHIFPSNLAVVEINEHKLTNTKGWYVAHIYEAFNPFFDIVRNWVETAGQLSCHFMSEVDMSHVLAVLHDAHDTGLNNTND